MENQKKLDFILEAYHTNQDMIQRADSKASLSISIQTFLLGVGIGISVLDNIFGKAEDAQLSIAVLFFITLGIFILSSVGGIISSLQVYRARPPMNDPEAKRSGLLFFGHIVRFPSHEDYLKRVSNIDGETMFQEFSHQTYTLSQIAHVKMKHVNLSIKFIIINIGLAILLLLLTGFLRMS